MCATLWDLLGSTYWGCWNLLGRLVRVANKESWGFPRRLCWRSALGNLGCSQKSANNKLVNRSGTSEVRVLTFGLKRNVNTLTLLVLPSIDQWIFRTLLGATPITQTPNGSTIIWKSQTSLRAISRFWSSWTNQIFWMEVVEGGRELVYDSRSMKPRFRDTNLLITHVLDLSAKLLAVLHISRAQGWSVDLSVEIATGWRRMSVIISTPGRLAVALYGA